MIFHFTKDTIRWVKGIKNLITTKFGFPLFLAIILLGYILIRNAPKTKTKSYALSLYHIVFVFILFYLLALPLGGYREYRPFILRRDTLLPITLALIFLYGLALRYFIHFNATYQARIFISATLILGLIFTWVDRKILPVNECQKDALKSLSMSSEEVPVLRNDCTILAWDPARIPASSQLAAEMLYHWRVTKTRKLFVQRAQEENSQ